MKLFRVKVAKEELTKLSEEEQVYLFQLSHFLNELSMLQKCVFISANNIDGLNEVEKQGQISSTLFFIRLLAGKLFEAWRRLGNSKIHKGFEGQLSPSCKDSLRKIRDYFNQKDNLVCVIRNKFAFHYDKEEIEDELRNIKHDEPLEMFLPTEEEAGICLYAFSDLISHRAMLGHTHASDIGESVKKLFDEIVRDVSKWFLDFGGEYMLILVKKMDIDHSKIELPDPPSIRDLRLPYFIKR
jgi:hypothetical protein